MDPHPDSDTAGREPDAERPPRAPRWVIAFGVAFLALVVLFIVMAASGHGPGNHMAMGR